MTLDKDDLVGYDRYEKPALRNMTIQQLIEKLSEREEVIRDVFNMVYTKDNTYPQRSRMSQAAEKIADEESDRASPELEHELEEGLKDMRVDMHRIRAQIRERLFALGKNIYGEDVEGKVKEILESHDEELEGVKQDIESLEEHGHDNEVSTDEVTYPSK